MAKISDKLKPSQTIIDIFVQLARYLPTLPIAPVPDVAARCFKDKKMLDLVCSASLTSSFFLFDPYSGSCISFPTRLWKVQFVMV
jgi:hypothetical protein